MLKRKQNFYSLSRFFKFFRRKKEKRFDIKEILLNEDGIDKKEKMENIIEHLNKENLDLQNFIFETNEFKKLFLSQSFLDSLRLPIALKIGNIGFLIRYNSKYRKMFIFIKFIKREKS